jgi:hypothetical protein
VLGFQSFRSVITALNYCADTIKPGMQGSYNISLGRRLTSVLVLKRGQFVTLNLAVTLYSHHSLSCVRLRRLVLPSTPTLLSSLKPNNPAFSDRLSRWHHSLRNGRSYGGMACEDPTGYPENSGLESTEEPIQQLLDGCKKLHSPNQGSCRRHRNERLREAREEQIRGILATRVLPPVIAR